MKHKFLIVLLFIFSVINVGYGAGNVCDFDSNTLANDSDLIIMLAYLQTKGLADLGIVTLDIPTVQSAARNLLNNQTLVVARLPDTTDDLENASTSTLGDNDLIIFLAYLQTKGLAELGIGSLDFSTVEQAAGQLLNKSVGLGKFPGTPIGDSSFTTTITGITTDP